MNLRKSERRQSKIKMALQGPSGSGKTMSSLLLAKGLAAGDMSKIAVIDTENGSADLYSHIGKYNVLTIEQPFTPESYIQAIDICEKAGMEVIIIDSISHEWDELLDFHSKLAGNSFTNWAKVTPRQKAFVDKILQCKSHIIATMRTKQDYVLNQKDGKMVPEKVGLKSVQRDGLDYEFTIVLDIDIKHFAVASKDRTGLFMGKPDFTISENTGEKILCWCNEGSTNAELTIQDNRKQKTALPRIKSEDAFSPTLDVDRYKPKVSEMVVYEAIQACQSIQELLSIYKQFPEYQEVLRVDYEAKKSLLMNNPNKHLQNGQSRFQ